MTDCLDGDLSRLPHPGGTQAHAMPPSRRRPPSDRRLGGGRARDGWMDGWMNGLMAMGMVVVGMGMGMGMGVGMDGHGGMVAGGFSAVPAGTGKRGKKRKLNSLDWHSYRLFIGTEQKASSGNGRRCKKVGLSAGDPSKHTRAMICKHRPQPAPPRRLWITGERANGRPSDLPGLARSAASRPPTRAFCEELCRTDHAPAGLPADSRGSRRRGCAPGVPLLQLQD